MQVYTRQNAIDYATITLSLMIKTKIKATPKNIATQMDLVFDLYDIEDLEEQRNKIMKEDRLFHNMQGKRVGYYMIDIFNSLNKQEEIIEKFCSNSELKLVRKYISPIGKQTDEFYEIINDIRNKNIDILVINVFSLYAIQDNEDKKSIVKQCRKNGIHFIEI